MSIRNLEKYLPENSLPFLRKWFGDHYIHIKITKERHSKLGDYRKMPDRSHQITLNSTLPAQLFFFVLTHDLAHLLAFDRFGMKISPHGKEWKATFALMLGESISVYDTDLQPVILDFMRSPKANFMASPDLVRYFRQESLPENHLHVEDLAPGDVFVYRQNKYELMNKAKKNYICKNLSNGRTYLFRALAQVKKYNHEQQ